MQRRRALIAARAGKFIALPPQLCIAAPDHLNAEIWRGGFNGSEIGAQSPDRQRPSAC